MKVNIDGKEETVPLCTCGKCLVRRLRKEHFLSYPYNRGLKSVYRNDFGPNKTSFELNDPTNSYIKAKICNLDGTYREHIPTSLLSEHKLNYKPFKVMQEEKIPTKHEIDKAPFLGNTTYRTHYNGWGSTLEGKPTLEKLPDIKVPLRGDSNYKESYIRYPKPEYEKKDTKIIPKSNLEFFGKLNPDTTYNTSYEPVNFNQPHYFSKDDKVNKANWEKTHFVPAEFPPSNFESSYKRSIGNFDKSNVCKLREFLIKRGKTCLEI